jgi:F0F1-type ATP synthase membrane subunit b/b'
MKELIDKIVAAEQEARQITEAARKHAAEIQRAADERINREKNALKKSSRDLVMEKTESARNKIRSMTVPPLPDTRASILKELNISSSQFQKTTDAVRDILVKPDFDNPDFDKITLQG